MYGFKETQPKHSTRGKHPNERKVIKGIIHKKCPLCNQWLPETEFNKKAASMDSKQSYCTRCALLYYRWHRAVCKHYNVKRLSDIQDFVQPERGNEMHRYVQDILAYEFENQE